MNEKLRSALHLADKLGRETGRARAVTFLFAGSVDDDTIIQIKERLENNDPITVEIVRAFAVSQEGQAYPPNDLALSTGMMSGDSPYNDYLTLCEAFDEAAYQGAVQQIALTAQALITQREERR